MGGKAHAVELGPITVCFSKQMRFGCEFLRARITEEAGRSEEMRKGGFHNVTNSGRAAGPAPKKRRA